MKQIIYCLHIIYVLTGFINQLVAQNYKFEHLTLEDGLVDNAIFSIHLDREGFLWFGTCNGLVKYDGNSTKTFQWNADQNFDLAGGCIYHIDENQAGNFWLATYHGLCFFDVYKNELSYFPHLEQSAFGIENAIWFAHEDKYGQVWMINHEDELLRMNLETKEVIHFHANPATYPFFKDNKVSITRLAMDINPAFYEAANGDIWIGTREKGLLVFRQEQQSFVSFDTQITSNSGLKSNRILNIFADQDQQIWLGTAKGLHLWNPTQQTFTSLPETFTNTTTLIADSMWVNLQDKAGNLWLAGKGASFKLNPQTNQLQRFPFDHKNSFVVPIFAGDDGSFWVLEWQPQKNITILYELDRKTKKYTPYISNKKKEDHVFSGIGFSQYISDNTRVLWIGSFREGVNKLDVLRQKFRVYTPEKKQITTFRSTQGLAEIQLMTDQKGILWQIQNQDMLWIRQHLTDKEGNIWMVNNHQPFQVKGLGITKFNTQTDTYEVFFDESDTENSACGNSANVLLLDSNNNLWIGFWDYFTDAPAGLVKYSPRDNSFQCFQPDPTADNSLAHESITDLHEDEEGNIWITFVGVKGEVALQKLNPVTEKFTNYTGFKSSIWEIEPSQDGNLWLGTILQGLVKFDPLTGQIIKQYRQSDGLANSSVQDIETDLAGNLWLRTEFGLAKFDPVAEAFSNYTTADGLLTNRSNGTRLSFQSEDGTIFMASIAQTNEINLTYFTPEQVKDNPYPPQLAFTDFKLFNKEVAIGAETPLQRDISKSDNIYLSHWQNDITLSFAALHFNRPEKNQYAYKLEPNDSEWRYIGNQNTITLSNLGWGDYTLKVKAANYDGVWNEEGIEMGIFVATPWWRTNWAYGFYLLSILLLIYAIYQFELRRQLAKSEANRLQELSNLKTQFFTNISHELRTPLTVILGVSQLQKTYAQGQQLVHHSANRLLQLVNQLLDLAKLDAGSLKIREQTIELVSFLKYLLEVLKPLADEKSIDLSFKTEVEELQLLIDQEKLQQIITNLLANAIKFSHAYGQVSLTLTRQEEVFMLNIRDNGIGIASAALPFIFERFYQVERTQNIQARGTGIGLSLVKELVELLEGSIGVESQIGAGTQFTVIFPIKKGESKSITSFVHLPHAVAHPSTDLIQNDLAGASEKPILLLVEDETDIVIYLQHLLEETYEIILAPNGQVGVELAIKHIPDIIISDVMMPQMNGIELVQQLKTDNRTNHIPIILLTAKGTQDDKVVGLEHGADAYISKPFDVRELQIRLVKLLAYRKLLQEKYAQQIVAQPTSTDAPRSMFIDQLRNEIETDLQRNLTVEQLAQLMHITRVQLYRKVKAITGHSPSVFANQVRLNRAVQLLQNTELSIAEIAYQVGFNDPAYFTRIFTKTYGRAPSRFNSVDNID